MAAVSGRVLRKRKRRGEGDTHWKLGLDEKVEVRSVEDGFLGSWHLGTVIACDDTVRQVEYDHILLDDGSGNLVESVLVSPILDGVVPSDEKAFYRLGVIRPLPPPREFSRRHLPYGQCVDLLYQDAWWEGVIFDREEGNEERKIFFPEMGDEMKGHVDKLRITQDWDEVTEEWQPRGSWVFLQVVEEIEKLYPLLISVKQIWYEVQVKVDYEKFNQWTSTSRDTWRKLVKEVVHDNTKLTIKQIFSELNSSQVIEEGGQLLEFSELALDAKLNLETYFDNLIAPFTEAACKINSAATLPMDHDVSHLELPMDKGVSQLPLPNDEDISQLPLPTDQDDSHVHPVEKQFVPEDFAPATKDVQLCSNCDCRSIPPTQNEDSSVSSHDFSILLPPIDGTGILSSTTSHDPPTFANSKPLGTRPRTKKKKFEGQTLVGEPDSCPEAIAENMSFLSLTKNFKKLPSDDTAGILSSSNSEPPNFTNSKPRRGRPPTEKKKPGGQAPVGEPDSCPEAIAMSSIKEVHKHPRDDTAGILSSSNSEPPNVTNSKPCSGRPPTEKKKLESQAPVGEPDSCPEAIAMSSIKEVRKHPRDDTAGILSSSNSEPPNATNSQPRRGRPTEKKKLESQALVVELDSCPEAIAMSLVKEVQKPPSDDTGGILSSSDSEPPNVTNSKSRRGRPTEKKKLESQALMVEPDSCPEAIAMSLVQEVQEQLSDDIAGNLSSAKSEPPTSANVKPRRGRPPTKKKKFKGQTVVGEPDSSRKAIAKDMPSMSLAHKFRNHLLCLGWRIVILMDCGIVKRNYIAPDGTKVFHSLRKVRQVLEESKSHRPVLPVEQASLYGSTDNFIQSPRMARPGGCREVPELPELPSPSEETINDSEICRQAVIDYCSPKSQDVSAYQKSYRHGVKIGDTSIKAKKHLAATGWEFYTIGKKDKKVCYRSPEGKTFLSFRKACKWCVEKWKAENQLSEQVSSPSTAMKLQSSSSPTKNSCERLAGETPLRNGNIKINDKTIPRKKRKHCDVKDVHTGGLPILKGQISRRSLKKVDGIGSHSSAYMMRPRKRARNAAPSSSNQTPRTVLSWLIDNNVVLPRAKVQYWGKKYGTPMAEGRITREGIKCNCCQKIFGLRNFQAHAGSNCHCPSENIFLDDGRSLLECQLEMKCKHSVNNTSNEPCDLEKDSSNINDYICSVCHYGGELILCDECPSSFHRDCLGMKDVPDGDWFCPSCCCKVCGESRIDTNRNHFTDNTVLICCQCDHKFHAQCLRSKVPSMLDNYPEGNWFCNKNCELIFLGLNNLLGKPVIVGDDNLTWTLLRYIEPDDSGSNMVDYGSSVENYSRLTVALNVMHECFEPVKEAHTRRDIVEDVIFSRRSKLNRLNFEGFYTVLLERNEELITVATVRVLGDKVAEIPLVATQFQHRRLGMCRILMNELEKKLMELGVERLVLPAVPAVLNTWTTSFGFSEMEKSERANFLDYTFLGFQGTVMCQKILGKTPSPLMISNVLTEPRQTYFDNTSSKDNVESDDNTD